LGKKYSVKGMVCSNCADGIERILKKKSSVFKVDVSYDDKTMTIEFKKGKDISLDQLNTILESDGYLLSEDTPRQKNAVAVGSIMLILALLLIFRQLGFNINPEFSENMSYSMLFLAGILTSFHCVAMCGGIALSQSITLETHKHKHQHLIRAAKYNAGRVISYSILGGVIGAIGSVVSVGGSFRGIVSIIAGGFMILLSLNMLGLIKFKLPTIVDKGKASKKNSEDGPFYVGLANGFMPCGPLQTMQLYALGTGTMIGGFSAMFFFALGTVPMMLGLGLFTGLLSKNGGRKFIQASAVVVLLLGLIMVNRGLLLGGNGVSLDSNIGVSEAEVSVETDTEVSVADLAIQDEVELPDPVPYQIIDGVQVVQMTVKSDRYVLSSPLVAGIPARIELDIESITRCNSPILIPKAGIEVDLQRNDPVMEFTPEEIGELRVTCWMGMITTNATIVESL